MSVMMNPVPENVSAMNEFEDPYEEGVQSDEAICEPSSFTVNN